MLTKNKFFAVIAIFLTLSIPFSAFACGLNTDSASIVKASSQYLSVLSNLGIDGGTMSMSGWIKLSSNPVASEYIFFEQSSAGTSHVHYYLEYLINGANFDLDVNRARAGTANCRVTKASANFGTTSWHFVAYTYDGANENLYVDGSLAAGPVACSGNGVTNNNHFSIGTGDTSESASFTPTDFADALIDDVRVYNTALSASTANGLFSAPANVTGSETNLIDGYPMNSDLTTDVGSGAHNLTNTNTVTQSTTVPFAGTSCATPFNGSDDDWMRFFTSMVK